LINLFLRNTAKVMKNMTSTGKVKLLEFDYAEDLSVLDEDVSKMNNF
jgi:hypothetical protein